MAYNSFMTTSWRLTRPIADSVHPTKARAGSGEASEAHLLPGPNGAVGSWLLSEHLSSSRNSLEATQMRSETVVLPELPRWLLVTLCAC